MRTGFKWIYPWSKNTKFEYVSRNSKGEEVDLHRIPSVIEILPSDDYTSIFYTKFYEKLLDPVEKIHETIHLEIIIDDEVKKLNYNFILQYKPHYNILDTLTV